MFFILITKLYNAVFRLRYFFLFFFISRAPQSSRKYRNNCDVGKDAAAVLFVLVSTCPLHKQTETLEIQLYRALFLGAELFNVTVTLPSLISLIYQHDSCTDVSVCLRFNVSNRVTLFSREQNSCGHCTAYICQFFTNGFPESLCINLLTDSSSLQCCLGEPV